MKNITHNILIMTISIVLSGCILNQPKSKMNKDPDIVSLDSAKQFIADKTTKAEIREKLGVPGHEHEKGDGWSQYQYYAACGDGTNYCLVNIVFENNVYKWAQTWTNN